MLSFFKKKFIKIFKQKPTEQEIILAAKKGIIAECSLYNNATNTGRKIKIPTYIKIREIALMM